MRHSRTSEGEGFRVDGEVVRGIVAGIRSQKCQLQACVRHAAEFFAHLGVACK